MVNVENIIQIHFAISTFAFLLFVERFNVFGSVETFSVSFSGATAMLVSFVLGFVFDGFSILRKTRLANSIITICTASVFSEIVNRFNRLTTATSFLSSTDVAPFSPTLVALSFHSLLDFFFIAGITLLPLSLCGFRMSFSRLGKCISEARLASRIQAIIARTVNTKFKNRFGLFTLPAKFESFHNNQILA